MMSISRSCAPKCFKHYKNKALTSACQSMWHHFSSDLLSPCMKKSLSSPVVKKLLMRSLINLALKNHRLRNYRRRALTRKKIPKVMTVLLMKMVVSLQISPPLCLPSSTLAKIAKKKLWLASALPGSLSAPQLMVILILRICNRQTGIRLDSKTRPLKILISDGALNSGPWISN